MKFTMPTDFSKFSPFLRKVAHHHYTISFVAIGAVLLFAGYVVNQTLASPSDAQYKQDRMTQTIGTQFNKTTQDTISKVENLQISTDPSGQQPSLPPGRVNPFAE